MFDAFFITLREAAELLLCAEALRNCLRERGLHALLVHVRLGVAGGVAVAAAVLLALTQATFDPRIGALATIVFAGAMMFLAVGMLCSVRSLRTGMSTSVNAWIDRACTPLTVAAIMGLVTAREVIEIAIFLRGAWSDAGPGDVVTGALLGIVASFLVWVAYRATGARAGLYAAFRISALLLALISAELLVSGLDTLADAQARLDPQSTAATGFNLVVEHGAQEGWLFVLLMLFPTFAFLRGWWTESSVA